MYMERKLPRSGQNRWPVYRIQAPGSLFVFGRGDGDIGGTGDEREEREKGTCEWPGERPGRILRSSADANGGKIASGKEYVGYLQEGSKSKAVQVAILGSWRRSRPVQGKEVRGERPRENGGHGVGCRVRTFDDRE